MAKKFNYDSDGYNGDTEGKYDIPDDVNIGHFDVEVAAGELLDDEEFEPPIDEDEYEEKPTKENLVKKLPQQLVSKIPKPKKEVKEYKQDVGTGKEKEIEVEESKEEEEETTEETHPEVEELGGITDEQFDENLIDDSEEQTENFDETIDTG